MNNSILIVDDEKSGIMALTLLLSADYTVYAARNGADAIEIAQEFSPDLILLDVIMPDLSGYEVMEKLKNEEKTKNIPVIFMTGLESEENIKKGMDMGAVAYIKKTFTNDEVIKTIKTHIN